VRHTPLAVAPDARVALARRHANDGSGRHPARFLPDADRVSGSPLIMMNGSVNLADLGRRVRAARLARRLTLEEVVSRADFTVSWLSKLENGQLTPSLEGLVKLADVLECGIDKLVEGLSTPPRHVLVKRGQGRIERGRNGRPSTIEYLADQWRGPAMRPVILYLDGAERRTAIDSHDGQRFLFVIDGDVRVEYGDEAILLSTGDSIYIDATIPHGMAVAGKGKARVLSVSYEPLGGGLSRDASRGSGPAGRKAAR
jgi:transcriptional regulator with XRE-family HTH domain